MTEIDYMGLASCLSEGDIKTLNITPGTDLDEEYGNIDETRITKVSLKQCDNDAQVLSAYKQYLESIPNLPLLTKEEEYELSVKSLAGDMNARNALIEHNLRFVIHVALRYTDKGLDIMDLIQEGNLGLVTAAERFDATRGFRFTTYAAFWITQRIRSAVLHKNGIIAIPSYISSKIKAVLTVRNEYIEKYNRDPTEEEICAATGMSKRVLRNIMSIPSCNISLDEAAGSTDSDADTLMNIVCDDAPSPEVTAESEHLKEILESHMATLSDKERLVINLYFGLNNDRPHNGSQIGQILGLHRERIRQIKNDALKKMAIHKSELRDFLED